MADIGMYYPDVFVQDEAWLKAAALYWPKLARLMPADYPQHDSPTAQILTAELDFFVDIDPEPYAREVGYRFLMWLREADDDWYHHPPEVMRWLVKPQSGEVPMVQLPGTPLELPYRWIHERGSTPASISERLIDRGLAVRGVDEEGRGWVRMERHFAQIYVTALADSVAVANDMPMITDQQGLPEYPQGFGQQLALSHRGRFDLTSMYAVLALNTVLPADLGTIPAERIVRARRVLADEFDAFRHHLDALSTSFADLSSSEDPAVLNARLRLAVDRDIRTALNEIERGLRSEGLEPVRAIFSLKTPEVPIVLAVLGTTFAGGGGLPKFLLDTGAIAACFVSSASRARAAKSKLRRSPGGYLLGVREELNPHGLIDRIHRAARRPS